MVKTIPGNFSKQRRRLNIVTVPCLSYRASYNDNCRRFPPPLLSFDVFPSFSFFAYLLPLLDLAGLKRFFLLLPSPPLYRADFSRCLPPPPPPDSVGPSALSRKSLIDNFSPPPSKRRRRRKRRSTIEKFGNTPAKSRVAV